MPELRSPEAPQVTSPPLPATPRDPTLSELTRLSLAQLEASETEPRPKSSAGGRKLRTSWRPSHDPARTPILPIALTMVVSFFVALGVILWRRPHEPSRPERAVVLPADPPANSAPLPPSSAPAQEAPATAPSVPSVSPAPRAPDPSPRIAELPVQLYFTRHVVHDESGRARFPITGWLENRSGSDLSVEIELTGFRTQQTTNLHVDLEANGKKSFGVDDGVELNANDLISLKSGSYAELVTRVH